MAAQRIVFLNQAGGPLFREFVRVAGAALGPARYYTADATPVGEGVEVVRAPRYRRDSGSARLLSWSCYMAVVAAKILLRPRRPLLFIVTNPPLAPLIGYLARKVRGQRYVLLFYDMYPEALESFAGLSSRSKLARLWRHCNRLAIRNAEAVITISPDMARTLSQYELTGPGVPSKVHIVPTWVDTAQIRPRAKRENWFAQQHGQVDKLTVLYGGNLGAVHDLSMLPDVAARLQDDPLFHFMVIAEPVARKALEERCAQLKLRNVSFLPLQDEAALPFSLTTADIGLVALAEGGEGVSMPSKTYYLMAAGCALLGFSSLHSDLATLLRQHDCGINVAPHDVNGAVQVLRQWRADPSGLAQCRARARAAAEQYFSRDVCVPRMLAVVQALLHGASGDGPVKEGMRV
ncbi:MAG: glycosyltransferase family 4 protein [Planctomycetota bacterium]